MVTARPGTQQNSLQRRIVLMKNLLSMQLFLSWYKELRGSLSLLPDCNRQVLHRQSCKQEGLFVFLTCSNWCCTSLIDHPKQSINVEMCLSSLFLLFFFSDVSSSKLTRPSRSLVPHLGTSGLDSRWVSPLSACTALSFSFPSLVQSSGAEIAPAT